MNNQVIEEGITINSYGTKISKELEVFYNPVMKLNRDISLLVIKTYFSTINKKKIKFCDPMGASGIRELRFLKTIPEIFEKITIGDISGDAISNIKKNFEYNNISMDNIELERAEAINTISKQYYDFIEIDPFGSPIEFLDIAIQRIKHNGILSITATDTAALCGTYPKTTLRRYGMSVKKTLCFDEIGIRNLISYAQIQAAKYDKSITVLLSYAYEHYYKIFFKVEEGREKAYDMINKLSYITWDKITQEIKTNKYQNKEYFGKTYIGGLINKEFISNLITNLNLINDKKEIEKLLNSLNNELNDVIGYYIPAKFQKEFKISSCPKFEIIEKKIIEKGYTFSRPHNNNFGIKTNCPYKEFIEIIKYN